MIKKAGGRAEETKGKKEKGEAEARLGSKKKKSRQRCEFELICVRLSSVETASHALLTSAAGWDPCAGLHRLPGTLFLTGFRQRAENMSFGQQATATKVSLWKS